MLLLVCDSSLPFCFSLVLKFPWEVGLWSTTSNSHCGATSPKALLPQWPSITTPRKLRGANTVQGPGVSWGRRLSPYHGCCDGGVFKQGSMSSRTLKETALAGSTSAHWVLSKSKDSEMTPWGSAMGLEEITTSSESPFPPTKPKSFHVRPSSFSPRHSSLPHSSSLHPPSDFWLAALPVCQTAHMCLNPDKRIQLRPFYSISFSFKHKWESKSPNTIFSTRNC